MGIFKKLLIWECKGLFHDFLVRGLMASGDKLVRFIARLRGIIAIMRKIIDFLERVCAVADKAVSNDGMIDNCEAEEIICESEKIAKEVF